MPHEYERRGVFTLDEVLPYVPSKGTQRVVKKYCGKSVSLSKKRLRIFATKGTTCVCCGIKGTFLALERHKNSAIKWHFNLYAVDSYGTEVQMTLDHIIPRAKGGSSDLDNLQPMCEPCNLEKGASLENPECKVRKWNSNKPKNLTKLSASWKPFVKKKPSLRVSFYCKTHTCQQMMSSED